MLRALLNAAVFAMCLSSPAKAHPHIFVDARSGFLFGHDGHLEALRISWTYDEFTTLVLFETLSLDSDGDGLLDADDKAAIIEGETVWIPGYKGDVYLEIAGDDYPLGRPKDAQVVLENNRVEVVFNLPLSEPVIVAEALIKLRLYDPTYYYAYTILPQHKPFALPDTCQSEIISFEPDAAATALQTKLAALSREDTPKQPDIGRFFSDEVVLTCG